MNNAETESKDSENAYWIQNAENMLHEPHMEEIYNQLPPPAAHPTSLNDAGAAHFYQPSGYSNPLDNFIFNTDLDFNYQDPSLEIHEPVPLNFYNSFRSRSPNTPFSTAGSSSFGTDRDYQDFNTPDSESVNPCYGTHCDAQACAERDCGGEAEYEIVECTEPSCEVRHLSCGGNMPPEAVEVAAYLQSPPSINPWSFGNEHQPMQFNSMVPNDFPDDYHLWPYPGSQEFNGFQEVAQNSILPKLSTIEPCLGGPDEVTNHQPKRRRGPKNLEIQPSFLEQPIMNMTASPGFDEADLTCYWQNCNQFFDNPMSRDAHVHEDHFHSQLKMPCTQNDCSEFEGLDLNTHLKRKHNLMTEEEFCNYPDCGFDSSEIGGLEQHVDQKHSIPVGNLFCAWKDCKSTTLETPEQLADHLGDHGVRVWANHECKWKNVGSSIVCGERFHSPKELQEHTKTTHLAILSKKLGYICRWEGCERASKTEESKQGFAQRGKLERHMQSHTKYKACKCTICDKDFSAEQALEQHMRTHDGKKPFSCEFPDCGKAFAQASALTMHKRTHTGEKPLQCDMCTRKFAESSNLSKHKKTHNTVGKYKCEEVGCGKTYHRPDQLRNHTKNHHGKEDVRVGVMPLAA